MVPDLFHREGSLFIFTEWKSILNTDLPFLLTVYLPPSPGHLINALCVISRNHDKMIDKVNLRVDLDSLL